MAAATNLNISSSSSKIDSLIDPWIYERVHSWGYPESSEKIRITETRIATQLKIAVLDSEISALQSQIDSRQSQKDILDHQLSRCNSLFAPIRRLPEELLLEIFKHFTPDPTSLYLDHAVLCEELNRGGFRMLVLSASPRNVLQQVCRFWKSLVLHTPSMWTNLSFELLSDVKIIEEHAHPLSCTLDVLLTRSKQLPLDIDIEIGMHWVEAGVCLLPLLKECHRWRNLALCVSRAQLEDEAFQCFVEKLEWLESLSIRVFLDSNRPVRCFWFSKAPRLRSVVQRGSPLGRFPLPWGQLETLSARSHALNATVSGTLGSILSSPTLRSLEVGFFDYPDELGTTLFVQSLSVHEPDDLQYLSPINFPNLTELILFANAEYSAEFFSLVAAKLESLTFTRDFRTDDQPFYGDIFDDAVCFPRLTKLVIDRSHFQARIDWQNVVAPKQFPKLEGLIVSLTMEHFVDDWIELLCAFVDILQTHSDQLSLGAPPAPYCLAPEHVEITALAPQHSFLPHQVHIIRRLRKQGVQIRLCESGWIEKKEIEAEDIDIWLAREGM